MLTIYVISPENERFHLEIFNYASFADVKASLYEKLESRFKHVPLNGFQKSFLLEYRGNIYPDNQLVINYFDQAHNTMRIVDTALKFTPSNNKPNPCRQFSNSTISRTLNHHNIEEEHIIPDHRMR